MPTNDMGDGPPDMAAWIARLLDDDDEARQPAVQNTDWAPIPQRGAVGARFGVWRYRDGVLLTVRDGYPRTSKAARRPWYATADGILLLDPMGNPFHRSEDEAKACADTALLDGSPANWPHASMY